MLFYHPGVLAANLLILEDFQVKFCLLFAKTHLGELPPCVPVLVTNLLLHLGISEGLQEGAPNISLTLVPGKHW